MKVLLHVSKESKFKVAQANAKNLLKEDNNLEIAIVLNSDAVKVMTNNSLTLINDVKYYLCNNAITTYNINIDKLPKKALITNSGVYKILKLQSEGYYYIKS